MKIYQLLRYTGVKWNMLGCRRKQRGLF